jgi:hypothetical protein
VPADDDFHRFFIASEISRGNMGALTALWMGRFARNDDVNSNRFQFEKCRRAQ